MLLHPKCPHSARYTVGTQQTFIKLNSSVTIYLVLTLSQTLCESTSNKISHLIPTTTLCYERCFIVKTPMKKVQEIYPWFHKQEGAESGLNPARLISEQQALQHLSPELHLESPFLSFEPWFLHL
jgi:hypothetical protein